MQETDDESKNVDFFSLFFFEGGSSEFLIEVQCVQLAFRH